MIVEVDIAHRLGAFELDARFRIESGLIALFGPSGAGKSSILSAICGLLRPSRGRIAIDGMALFDSKRGIFVPPHARRVGVIFQDSRLFPHLTVRQNLLYGKWFAPGGAEFLDFDRVVGLLGIGHLLHRRPARLSGGEKQRVAIGRALLSAPRMLLLDEPLTALDEAKKQEILPYLERLRDELKLPMILISHDVTDVARLAQEMVVLDKGKVVASGPVATLFQRLDLTALIGGEEAGSLIEGIVDHYEEGFGLTCVLSPAGTWRIAHFRAERGEAVRLRVRARDVLLTKTVPPDISALNVIEGTVAAVAPKDAATVEVKLDCHGQGLIARLTRYSLEQLGLAPGTKVFAIVKSVSVDSKRVEAG